LRQTQSKDKPLFIRAYENSKERYPDFGFWRIFIFLSHFPKFPDAFENSILISKKNNPHFAELCYIEDVLSDTGQVSAHYLVWETMGLSIRW
jgi:hypothetical protein